MVSNTTKNTSNKSNEKFERETPTLNPPKWIADNEVNIKLKKKIEKIQNQIKKKIKREHKRITEILIAYLELKKNQGRLDTVRIEDFAELLDQNVEERVFSMVYRPDEEHKAPFT